MLSSGALSSDDSLENLPIELQLFEVINLDGMESQLIKILDALPVEILSNIHNAEGYTALHLACISG